ncbi:MAG: hypothetical protein CVU56_09455 [Deltaproteobacteria bacterium HGW-Deltaproteobacteria-14]|jgi:protein phosphatase|nr:MAG: hypothetical protein CVU56_09455 [Deltaproteobacteria bacterium HGW-Deltaproteobacteria-14]
MRKLTWAALTDVGMKRSGNEDAYVIAEEYGLYVVCDGMGGHASGEVASAMTTEEVVSFFRDREAGDLSLPYDTEEGASDPERILSNAIQHANDKVYVSGMKDPKLEGMGTTIVSVLDNGETLVLGHVGDSRIYRFRAGTLEQLTRDHSLLNHKIDMGELRTQEDIKGFKHGNIIVRAIGLKDYVRPEAQTVDRAAGDILLMCSDGLSDLVDDWAIENVLEANQEDLDEAARILVRMANDRGGKDNITVVLVRVDDDPEELAYGAEDFQEESTVPRGLADDDDEDTTDPARAAFDPNDDRDFRDITDADDSRTAPHTPVFMWEDLGEDSDDGGPPATKSTLKIGGDELGALRARRPGAALPPRRQPTPPPQRKTPSIIVDEEEDSDLPSIIIDDSRD